MKGCKRGKKVVGDGRDIISTLPDCILHQILSSIENTKSAVKTCVLSKRWRYVWTTLQNLHFDSCAIGRSRFNNFVNQVLLLRDNSISVSSLHSWSNDRSDPSVVDNMICYAVRHNVEKLLLHTRCQAPLKLDFGSCESLKSLTLFYDGYSIPLDKPLQLPALETLYLSYFSDGSADFITETVGNCPKLKTLIMDVLTLKSLKIVAPNLRNLELTYEECDNEWDYESKIVVSAPRLTSFKLEGNALNIFSAESLPCLENAHLDMFSQFYERWHPFFSSEDNMERMSLNLINMLEQLCEANSVTLSLKALEVLGSDQNFLDNHPSPFHKLKHLKLTTPYSSTLECHGEDLIDHVILFDPRVTYFTRGSSCDTLVVEFPSGEWRQIR